MNDSRMLPKPSSPISIVATSQSPTCLKFAAEYCNYNVAAGNGHNTPTAFAERNKGLVDAARNARRDVGGVGLFMVIAARQIRAAWAKWELINPAVR